jgi:tetratricopeptide (TPR) repeat protein
LYCKVLKLIVGFLSDHIIGILVFTFSIICRKSLSNLIERLTKFKWKGGGSEIEVGAEAPKEPKERFPPTEIALEDSREPREDQEKIIEEEAQEQNWFSEIHKAFEDGRIEDAKKVFDKYRLEEDDPEKQERNYAFFLYQLFEKGKDNSAIERLEKLANSSGNEESRYGVLIWLSFCLQDSQQTNADVELWEKAVKTFSSEVLITRSVTNLASALDRNGRSSDAKLLLLDRLHNVTATEEKAELFSALAQVEKCLGNKRKILERRTQFICGQS